VDPSRVSIYLDDTDTYREIGVERVAVAHSAEGLNLNPLMSWRWLSVGTRKVPSELG